MSMIIPDRPDSLDSSECHGLFNILLGYGTNYAQYERLTEPQLHPCDWPFCFPRPKQDGSDILCIYIVPPSHSNMQVIMYAPLRYLDMVFVLSEKVTSLGGIWRKIELFVFRLKPITLRRPSNQIAYLERIVEFSKEEQEALQALLDYTAVEKFAEKSKFK